MSRAVRHPNGLPKRNPLRGVPPIDHVWTPPTRITTERARLDRAHRRAVAREKADELAAANRVLRGTVAGLPKRRARGV